MAKKILSFEEYQVQLKSEQDNVDTTEEVENEECPCGTDEDGNCLECEEGTEAPAEEIEDEDESEEEIEDEDSDDDDDEDGDDDDDDDDDEDGDDDETEEEGSEEVESEEAEAPEAEATEAPATVEEMLHESYAKVKEAAMAYEKDAYQDHTLEMYMKENAALIATLAAQAMEEGYGEVKETELTQEMYESNCNEMKEAFAKKMDELKEMYGAGKEQYNYEIY